MAVRMQNLPKKNFGQAHFTFASPSWWNYNEQQNSEPLSKNVCFKLEPPPQLYREAKHLGLQLLDQDSSSTQSIGQSQNAMRGTGSKDQCISSESGEFESCEKSAGSRMKPVFSFRNPEITQNLPQVDNSHTMAHGSFPYADHYFGGLLAPNGLQTIMGSQIVGMTAARVPLPLDLADDGLIYVNAKQYHGILRRRQSRAKLEAQNKLVKSRKPYLHESRHLHALKRVRGSGGRFLSKKKVQRLDPSTTSSRQAGTDNIQLQQKETSELEGHHCSRALKSSFSNGEANFRQQDNFSGIPVRIGGGIKSSGSFMFCGT